MRRNKSIRAWLISLLLCFSIIPLLFLGVVLSWHNYREKIVQVKDFQEQYTARTADNLSCFFHEQEQKLFFLTKTVYLPAHPPEEQQTILAKFLVSSKDSEHGYMFDSISLFDEHGQELHSVYKTRPNGKNFAVEGATPVMLASPDREGINYYGPVYFDETAGDPRLKMGVWLHDLRSGARQGLLVAELRLRYLWDLIAAMQVGRAGVAYVVNSAGKVIAHPNPSIVLRKTNVHLPKGSEIKAGLSGKKSVVVAARLDYGGEPMFLVTESPVTEALAHIWRSTLIIGVIICLSLVAAIGLGIVLVRQLVWPVESLAETARAISRGDYGRQAKPGGLAELTDLAATFNAMTARLVESIKRQEAEKNFVQHAIESLSHPFYVINASDYTVKLANSACGFGKLTGRETCHQLTHGSAMPCDSDEHPCPLREIRQTRKPMVAEHVHRHEDGTAVTYEVYGYPVFGDDGELIEIIEYNVDITKRKTLEDHLRQSQKLEAIGSLAGGVAHDFNNILTTIIGYSEIGLSDVAKDAPIREHLQTIRKSGYQAAELTRQLLAFSRKQVMKLQVIDLNHQLAGIAKMLGRLIGERIEMKLQLNSPECLLLADCCQMDQVVMNLAVNARDAMPEGGRLVFATETIVLDQDFCDHNPELTPGRYVTLTVTDSGHGMTPEIQEKIFEPFFTTKGVGQGTGLGLAMIYGIVKQHHGHIIVESEPDKGAKFTLFFPATEEDPGETDGTGEPVALPGHETILVVDDDASIRKMISDMLQPLGYEVIVAHSPEQAIEVCRDRQEEINLLLTDVVMPGMNGSELAEAVSAIRPELKVLFMSGYAVNVIARDGVLAPGIHYLDKPVTLHQLTSRIREIFDAEIAAERGTSG